MTKTTTVIFGITILVTIAAVVTWQITGGDYYTKFELVEEVEKQIDPDDPLAGTGFYDGDTLTETVTRKGLRFGLLPTPSGLLDKHMLSVVSVASPLWVVSIGSLWWTRRKRKRAG